MVRKGEKTDWVSESKRENKTFFSELDVLLQALDRFFTADNVSIPPENLTAKNFYDELLTVRDAILHILGILEVVIPESRKNAYWFQQFAESKLMSPRKRDAFRESLYKQDTQEKGLYLLYDSFMNLKGVISDLLRTGHISYMGFMNIGRMINKEIRENIYFNPFKKPINPEFDYISNPEISEIVRSLKQRDVRKHISVIYISLFRFLRFMSFIDLETKRPSSLNPSLMILVLLRTEMGIFLEYIDKALKKVKDPELEMLLKALSYQCSIESKRVFLQELRDVYRMKLLPDFRGRIENSHGILKNLTEQSIVQMTQFFNPQIKGEEVFSSFLTKFQQSLRLREDLFVLHSFLEIIERAPAAGNAMMKVFESLRSYMVYFESFTFRLLRYDDYEEFFLFFTEINGLKKDELQGTGFAKIMKRIANFRIYIETTLRQIEQRSELSGKELDHERVEALIRQYI